MDTSTTIRISLPESQLELLRVLKDQNSKLIGLLQHNAWLDEKEAGERFKVDRQTVARWRKEGWLRHIKEPGENGRVRYRVDQFDEDVEARLGVVKYRY
ncbi:helix-turn-helix domain-containing protein [Dyadobacter sp. LHD-138]|uniref:helix-turn-helix domain-containing protein n=1 Tax=Dyadobacter sp. LHD-138 TaxID=3071413 RepID=UPI0027E169D2|nr:helix-turn-helix domain-containing protein [Dyadobacter sp. LHD-138]MDQ6479999.1 hypothetical protein [Dyadobacter sp. LHD-138]